ncbi:MAG: hypothetical protein ACRYGG_21025 [Janthinobacterium lividum]
MATATKIPLGKNCKSYISATPVAPADTTQATLDTAIGSALGTALEMDLITDAKINMTMDTDDVSTRKIRLFKANMPTAADGTISATVIVDPSVASDVVKFSILRTAYIGLTPIFYAALDGDKAFGGSSGPAGNWYVKTLSRDESLLKAVRYDLELTPTTNCDWYTVANS